MSQVVLNLPRPLKKIMQVSGDLIALSIAFLLMVVLGSEQFAIESLWILGVVFIVGSLIGLKLFGVYNAIIRFSGIHLLELIILNQLLSLSALLVAGELFLFSPDLNSLVLLFLLSTFLLGGLRLAQREFVYLARPVGERVLIYGAGDAGAQILTSLRQDNKYKIFGFIDDAVPLQGTKLHGLEVFASSRLREVVTRKNIGMVIIAIPTVSRYQLNRILGDLAELQINVRTVPKISELLKGKSALGDLKEVGIEELLGREPVLPDETLLSANTFNKVVLVTGAGGSIGSELCRQIVSQRPKKLILIELTELALYAIQQELEHEWEHLISPILGSVADQNLMERIMVDEGVEVVYHAAAYKHVPLVESNPFTAIQNNVMGTKSLLEAALSAEVSSFTLISTDKAVRPTNIMGASKRLAEIMCQLASSKPECKTTISMVRFGNVLGSSGSVIPKFRRQIKSGGPVTVTHPDVTRYFMVIPEAVQLVLQASALSNGGEVFVLDMGEPVKITELAEKLIRLSGMEPHQSEVDKEGAIRIRFIGLRPGEKLFEELLISGEAAPTNHAKIKQINESYPSQKDFEALFKALVKACVDNDVEQLRLVLCDGSIDYKPAEEFSQSELDDTLQVHLEDQVEKNSHLKGDRNTYIDGDKAWSVKGVNEQSIAELPTSSRVSSGSKEYFNPNSSLVGRIFLSLLHKYFLFTRPLTLGTRCVVLNSRQEVLLVKHTYVSGWDIPGGGVAPGESIQGSVIREINEETGYFLNNEPTLLGIFHNTATTNRDHVALFVSSNFERSGTKINKLEIRSAKFFPVNSLPTNIGDSSAQWISLALKHCDNQLLSLSVKGKISS